MKRIAPLCLTIVAVSLTTLAGCMSRVIKEGYEGATGPKGTFTVLQAPSAPLGTYRNFVLGEIADPHNVAPVGFKSGLAMNFRTELASGKIPTDAAGKTAIVNVQVLYYEDVSVVGQAFGPLEEVVARVELVDKDTKRVLAVANCVGRTTSTVMQGVSKKAEGLAKGMVSFIEKTIRNSNNGD